MENEITLITLGFLFVRIGILITFAFVFYRILSYVPQPAPVQTQSQYARERSDAALLER